MIQITPQMRVLVAIEAVDGRRGIDGLGQLCRSVLLADPGDGTHFPHISGVISANFPLSISCGKRVSELPTIQGLAAAAA